MSVEQTNFQPAEGNGELSLDLANRESSHILVQEVNQYNTDALKSPISTASDMQRAVSSKYSDDLLVAQPLESVLGDLAICKIEDLPGGLDDLFTQGDAKRAKEILSKENSHLNTKEVNAKITALQEGLIDGDFEKFANTLKDLKPDERAKFAKELNRQLEEHAAGVKLTDSADGSLLLHKNDGGTAIQFNKEGTTILRTLEKNSDGDLNLKPGHVVNQKPEDAIGKIGEAAVKNMTGERLHDFMLIDRPYPLKDLGEPLEEPMLEIPQDLIDQLKDKTLLENNSINR